MPLHRRTDHKSLATSVGELNYRDIGDLYPIVFVHGVFMNGGLWDDVVFYLPPELRAIRPDFPLGGHSRAADINADLSLGGLARLVLEVIDRLDLQDVTLVANNSGGAICQRAVLSGDVRANRVARLLLTNCGSFDHLKRSLGECDERSLAELATLLNTSQGRREFFAALAGTSIPDEQMCELLGGFPTSPEVRHYARKALLGMLPGQTFAPPVSFAGPVSIVWGLDDRGLPLSTGEKLASSFPNAQLNAVRASRLLIPIDQPEILANAIINLLTCDVAKQERTL
jgi:pimeloyl-ACP methyl ester carboxylesterase